MRNVSHNERHRDSEHRQAAGRTEPGKTSIGMLAPTAMLDGYAEQRNQEGYWNDMAQELFGLSSLPRKYMARNKVKVADVL